jgi:aryl-alcohol dehydrogenase-like predicted oxidoreductase
VVIATKFGFTYDEDKREILGTDVSPDYIRWACEQSLRRLNIDYIDLYQLHCGASPAEAEIIFDALEGLVSDGKIRAYGWSTGDLTSARLLSACANGVAIQHGLNVLDDAPEMLALCEQNNLASINNSPLASGLLSGKYHKDTRFPDDDFRSAGHTWATSFENGRPKADLLDKIDSIRDILTAQGRTLVQGALAWIWAKNERTLPIPGIKTTAQAKENAMAMQFGPLSPEEMAAIETLLGG